MKPVPKTPASAKTPRSGKTPRRPTGNKDPVEVYCRVRPLGDNEDESCVQIISETVLQLTAPKVSLCFFYLSHRFQPILFFLYWVRKEAEQVNRARKSMNSSLPLEQVTLKCCLSWESLSLLFQ